MASSKEYSANTGDKSVSKLRRSESGSNLYSDEEIVLAYHGPQIYKAKVLKAEIRKNEFKYFVRYLVRNKNWDGWVAVDCLMKYTEENIQKQQSLNKKQGVNMNPKFGRSTQAKPKGGNGIKVEKEDAKSSGAKEKERKSKSSVEKGNAFFEKLVKIEISSTLKKQLVDDWKFVNNQNKLVKLPRSPNVDEILAMYLEYRSKKDGMITDEVLEILKGLRIHFDRSLSVNLLYKKEHKQFQELVTNNNSPSTIYGVEHLLRLFVKLPDLIQYANMDEDLVVHLQQKSLDFLKFLELNQMTFFGTYKAQQYVDIKEGVDKNPKPGCSTNTKRKITTDVKVEKDDAESSGGKGKKKKSESSAEKRNASVEKPIKIEIPSTLKKQLVDDWEFVNNQDKLVKLPRRPSVEKILDLYIEYMTKKDGRKTNEVLQIVNGLRFCFDRLLPVNLLYNKERKQFQQLVTNNTSPSAIYGAEHLLRLFVKLFELLPYMNMEEDLAVLIHHKLLDFLKFLQKRHMTFFRSYQVPKNSGGSAVREKMSQD